MEQVRCNVCGKELKRRKDILLEDALEIKKDWGYFSKKDLLRHTFIVCEDCYDKWIQTFVIPPEESERTEAM